MKVIQMRIREVALCRSEIGLCAKCSFQKQHATWIVEKTEERFEANRTQGKGLISGGLWGESRDRIVREGLVGVETGCSIRRV